MSKKDQRVDAYIARAADFAKPILNRIRKLVHAACPDLDETIKWRAPFFVFQGNLIAMPAFKQHCALIFWKGRLIFSNVQRTKLHRITSLSELPGDKILTSYIKKAVAFNETGVKTPSPKPKTKKALVVPDYFLAALKKNKKALTAFENFSPSHKREYVEWITEAKREETRVKRIKTALEWLTKGKSLNWKYQ